MAKYLKKIGIVLAVMSFIVSGLAFAQAPKKIKELHVKNNKSISEATILSKIKMKPGDTYSQDIANDDLKRLYTLGYFKDVSIDEEETAEGVIVTIIVEEKPIVKDIVFQGNAKISTGKLKKSIQTKGGEMLNYSLLAQDISELKALYSKSGFQQVDIRYETEPVKDENSVVVKLIVDEKTRARIKKVSVDGNSVVPSKTILGMMATRPAWFFTRGYFDEDAFQSDMDKIKAHYQTLGYLDIDIKPEFQYDDKIALMYITLHVVEGKKYITGDIELNGNFVFPKEEVQKKMKMKPGDPFNPLQIRSDMDAVREFYYHKGYMNVEMVADRKVDPSTDKINLIYTLQANEVVYVGKVEVKGNTKTKDIVIRRELRIYPGEQFDGDKIRRSKERLYNLGYFEDVFFDTQSTSAPNVKDLIVSVKETKTGEFAFGGGYSSIDEFIGFVEINQRNFDILNWPYFTGDGQDLSLRATVGTVRMDYEISWTEPWIFDYPLSFGFDLYSRTHARQEDNGYGYQERRTGGDLRLGKELTEYLRGDLIYKLEEVKISDLSDHATADLARESGENWISSLTLITTFDSRDNIYNPRKGYYCRLGLQNAGAFLGFDKSFFKGFLDTSYYHPFYEKVVLQLRGRMGMGSAYDKDKDIPIYERFYVGGSETVRGYKERRIGPRDPGSSSPIGGDAMAIGNIEATFPIYERLIKGAVFYDAGNCWEKTSDLFKFKDGLKQGVGAGVRVNTPIGPLKLDAGYPLTENQGDEKQVEWYFSVTHGF